MPYLQRNASEHTVLIRNCDIQSHITRACGGRGCGVRPPGSSRPDDNQSESLQAVDGAPSLPDRVWCVSGTDRSNQARHRSSQVTGHRGQPPGSPGSVGKAAALPCYRSNTTRRPQHRTAHTFTRTVAAQKSQWRRRYRHRRRHLTASPPPTLDTMTRPRDEPADWLTWPLEAATDQSEETRLRAPVAGCGSRFSWGWKYAGRPLLGCRLEGGESSGRGGGAAGARCQR